MPDAEIQAMSQTAELLESLDEAARSRVLDWLASRFDNVGERRQVGRTTDDSSHGPEMFDDFPTFFVACDPSTDEQRVLVGSYWLQEKEGEAKYYSAGVNKALRNMGHAVDAISKRFAALIHARPQLAIQVSKSGNTRQAKKQYRLTEEGKRAVERMLS